MTEEGDEQVSIGLHGADGPALPIFTASRHAATSRLHASWHSSGIDSVAAVADRGLFTLRYWSTAGSNFSGGSFDDGILSPASRFHKIVRKQPPSERQKFPTRPSICSSEIFPATRYIPLWRFKVSRNEVVVS